MKTKNNIIDLAKKLIQLNTESVNKKELKKALNLVLEVLKESRHKLFKKNGYYSLLFFNKESSKFKVILNGHLDIIPGKSKQLNPIIKGRKLYGLGAMDMKGNLASLIYAFKEISPKLNYPVALQIVTDEEIGGFYGTKYQIEKGVRADFVIAGEPTNFDIVHKAKGILWIKAKFYGKSAHSAYPWKGKNAIESASKFVETLKKIINNPKNNAWKTTYNLANITTNNQAFNKIPDECEIWLDIRYIPEEKESILEKIKNILPKDSKIEIVIKEPSMNVLSNNSFIKNLKNISQKILNKKIQLRGANGSSDARHYAGAGIPAVEFGPEGGGIGSDNEWVDINSLYKYYRIIQGFLLNLNK